MYFDRTADHSVRKVAEFHAGFLDHEGQRRARRRFRNARVFKTLHLSASCCRVADLPFSLQEPISWPVFTHEEHEGFEPPTFSLCGIHVLRALRGEIRSERISFYLAFDQHVDPI